MEINHNRRYLYKVKTCTVKNKCYTKLTNCCILTRYSDLTHIIHIYEPMIIIHTVISAADKYICKRPCLINIDVFKATQAILSGICN